MTAAGGVARPVWPAQGGGSSVSSMAMSGSGPGSASRIARAARRGSAASAGGILDGGGEADAAQAGREGLQPGEAEHQLVAALGFGQRVDLVDDHPGEAGEDARRLLVGEQQGEAIRAW